MTPILDALLWLLCESVSLVLRFVAAVSAPFCRKQPRYEDDI